MVMAWRFFLILFPFLFGIRLVTMIPDSIMAHLDHIRGTLYGGLVDSNPEVRHTKKNLIKGVAVSPCSALNDNQPSFARSLSMCGGCVGA
jgi:hypothetical protein